MAVIRQRKRNLILAVAIGIIISCIPFFIVVINKEMHIKKSEKEIKVLKSELDKRELREVIVAGGNIHKGDVLKEDNLKKVNVYVEEELVALNNVKDIVGKVSKIDIGNNTVITNDMVYEQENISDDVRLHKFSFVELNDEIMEGSYVDIRIVLPNGEDYVVAIHKKIEKRTETDIYIYVNEEDILMLSSAEVDNEYYTGCNVYAILYVRDYQEAAMRDYPPNAHVCELSNWDPNLLEKVFNSDNIAKRQKLEENLKEFQNKGNGTVLED